MIQKKLIILLLLIIIYTLCTFQNPVFSEQDNASENKFPLFTRGIEQIFQKRYERTDMSKLMDILGVKNNMTIVDVGAGTGLYAVAFAQYMQNTGSVFATDIDVDMVRHMETEKKNHGLDNFHPVLVEMEGVDAFYQKHTFDIMFFCHVFNHIRNKENYFRTLRDSLSKNGRLVIVQDRGFSPFVPQDVVNPVGLIKYLHSQSENSPWSIFAKKPGVFEIKDNSASALLLNDMTNDIDLFKKFCKRKDKLNNALAFSPEERSFANWLLFIIRGDEKTAQGLKDEILTPNIPGLKRMLNKMIVIAEFRPFLFPKQKMPYFDAEETLSSDNFEHARIVNVMKLAGFSLEHYEQSIPFTVVLIFKPMPHY